MPAESKAQQKLFGMALAVRKGEMQKQDATPEVLAIVNGDLTNTEIEKYAKTSHKGLPEYVKESLGFNEYFVVVKPGFERMLKTVIDLYEKEGLTLTHIRPKQLLLSEAKRLYKVHEKEDFYNDLCKYMASGISIGLGFSGDSNMIDIKRLLELKDEIRKKYGESDMRNVIHSSDNWAAVEKESSFYF